MDSIDHRLDVLHSRLNTLDLRLNAVEQRRAILETIHLITWWTSTRGWLSWIAWERIRARVCARELSCCPSCRSKVPPYTPIEYRDRWLLGLEAVPSSSYSIHSEGAAIAQRFIQITRSAVPSAERRLELQPEQNRRRSSLPIVLSIPQFRRRTKPRVISKITRSCASVYKSTCAASPAAKSSRTVACGGTAAAMAATIRRTAE